MKNWITAVAVGGAAAVTGGLVWLLRRKPVESLDPPPMQRTPIASPVQSSSQPTVSLQPTQTASAQPSSSNEAPTTGTVPGAGSGGTESPGFTVTIPPQTPTVYNRSSMQQIAGDVLAEESKYTHPTELDRWVKAHLEGTPQSSHIREVLEGTS